MTRPPHDSFWVIPGRLLAGPYPGAKDEDEARAKVADFTALGVTRFVDLTEETEGLAPYGHLLREHAEHLRFPIVDVDIPTEDAMRATLDAIEHELAEGHVVYVHCWGGVGRTGTVVGCRLIEDGVAADDVPARLVALREGLQRANRKSPETVAQRDFVARWVPA